MEGPFELWFITLFFSFALIFYFSVKRRWDPELTMEIGLLITVAFLCVFMYGFYIHREEVSVTELFKVHYAYFPELLRYDIVRDGGTFYLVLESGAVIPACRVGTVIKNFFGHLWVVKLSEEFAI